MSDQEDRTPFGPPAPAPSDPPSPPDLPAPPVDAGVSEHDGQASSPVAIMQQPGQPYQLGTDWSFGATGSGQTIALPRSRRSVAVALAVVLVAAVGAYFFLSRSKSSGGTALALTLSQGQNFRYHVDMSFNGSIEVAGQQAPINGQFGETFSWQVESVDGNGVATVKMTVEEMVATVNGQTTPAEGPFTVEIRVAKDGRILTAGNLAIAGSSSQSLAFPGTDQFLPLLPDHPVKPGDTWTKSFDQDFPFGSGKIHYTSNNTYLRNEDVNGVQAAVIAGTVKVPLDLTVDPAQIAESIGVPADPSIPKGAKVVFSGSMDLTQTAWLDMSKHTMLKGSVSGTMDMTMELKGVSAPAEIPGGKIGFSGTVNLTIRDLGASTTPGTGQGSTEAQDDAAKTDLRNAMVAAKVYFVDHASYKGLSPSMLGKIEPTLGYNASSKTRAGVVSVRDVTRNSVLLVTETAGGQAFCIVDDHGTTIFGKQDAKKAAGCSGGW